MFDQKNERDTGKLPYEKVKADFSVLDFFSQSASGPTQLKIIYLARLLPT